MMRALLVATLLAAPITVALPTGDRFSSVGRHVLALSPTGQQVAFVANDRLYVRALDRDEAPRLLAGDGSRDATTTTPFFSPDGKWIGFWQSRRLKKVATTGGPAIVLCEAQNPRGAGWADDNTILYGQGPDGIWQVSGDGGTPAQVVKLNATEVAHGPQLLPGTRNVLFTLMRNSPDTAQAVVQSLDTPGRRVLLERAMDARYVPTGHVVYANGNTLFATPFDVAKLALVGKPLPLTDDIAQAPTTGTIQFAYARDGTLAYVPLDAIGGAPTRTLVWVDRVGHEEPIKAPVRRYGNPRLSPDGTRVALEVSDRDSDIFVLELATGTLTRITSGPEFEFPAIWSPDGRTLVYGAGRTARATTDPRHLFRQRADGSGSAEALTQGPVRQVPYAITPDGGTLIFREHSVDLAAADAGDIMLLPLAGSFRPQSLLQTPAREINAELSPDGRWLAYQSDESGRDEIYVRSFPNVNASKTQVSTSGGARPLWARSGGELFYISGAAVMRVEVTPGTTFTATPPESLFAGPYMYGALERMYDVAPDSQRFLLLKEVAVSPDALPPARIVVLPRGVAGG